MIAVAFRFLAGRYHATPWDRHANEGAVEWPPSPWRILRAMVAASYRLEPPPDPAELARLLEELSAPPVYRVPRASEAHTRHYMPTSQKPTLVFDAFVAVGGGAGDEAAEILVGWPDAELDPSEGALLDRLLEAIGYLGRSESWVEARRTDWKGEPNVVPAVEAAVGVRDRVRLLSPMPSSDYEEWRRIAPKPKGRRATLPTDLLEVLHQDTGTLQRQGWSDPPGSTPLVYNRPDWLTEVRPVVRTGGRQARTAPTFARYAISSAVLPRLVEAVAIGERLRAALMSRAGHRDASALALFAGKDGDGNPLEGHSHAYHLPTDDDGDGRIDHFVVYAEAGFDEPARRAIESLDRLWGHGGHDLHLALIGLGTAADYSSTAGGTPLAAYSRVWESSTPVVLTRHPKKRRGRWVDTPEDQVRAMLLQVGQPEPAAIARIPSTRAGGIELPWFRFRRQRLGGGGRRAGNTGFGFRITFEEPVRGPIAIGYAAHVGLGQFVGVE